MDWSSWRVLSWRVSNTLDVHFCLETLEKVLDLFGSPAIFNSDQGSQFTSNSFTQTLLENDILHMFLHSHRPLKILEPTDTSLMHDQTKDGDR